MGKYNRSTYIRATAARLAREAVNDMDVICADNETVWIDLAMAQALAMEQPYLAESYLRAARSHMRAIQAAAAQGRRTGER